MDALISTAGRGKEYYSIWHKRGSKYLTSEEISKIKEEILNRYTLLRAEDNEKVANTVPLFATEDLNSIICSEVCEGLT